MAASPTHRAKLIAAVFLVGSLALPQYTCRMYRAPDGGVWSELPAGADTTTHKPFTERHYAVEDFDVLSLQFLLTIVVFTWPVGVLVIGRGNRRPRLSRVLWWLEPLLAAGSGYGIFVFSSLGQRAIGAYVGLAACALLLVAWSVELRARFRKPAPA